MPTPSDSQRPVDRRRYILRALQERGELSLKEIVTAFPNAARQSIRDDIDFLNELGFDIDAERRGRETVLVHLVQRPDAEVPEVRLEQKRMVASLSAGIVCGFGGPTKGSLQNDDPSNEGRGSDDGSPLQAPKWCRDIHSIKEVLSSCRADGIAGKHWEEVVRPALEDFWNHTNRLVAIDAGSTNLQTAELLKEIKMPCEYSTLTSLSVCTNGRKMFQLLGDQNVRIRAIVVGGQQIRSTSIIAGRLAEQFLSSASALNFGISLIGAIALDLRDYACRTSTQEEVGMKSLFMEKSSLRVVCLDNKKLVRQSHLLMRSGFNFARVYPKAIDLIVTNRPLRFDELPKDATKQQMETAIQEEHDGTFDEMLALINRRGIPCMVADRGPTGEIAAEFDASADLDSPDKETEK